MANSKRIIPFTFPSLVISFSLLPMIWLSLSLFGQQPTTVPLSVSLPYHCRSLSTFSLSLSPNSSILLALSLSLFLDLPLSRLLTAKLEPLSSWLCHWHTSDEQMQRVSKLREVVPRWPNWSGGEAGNTCSSVAASRSRTAILQPILVPKCSIYSPLQDGVLFCQQKSPDRWHGFLCKQKLCK